MEDLAAKYRPYFLQGLTPAQLAKKCDEDGFGSMQIIWLVRHFWGLSLVDAKEAMVVGRGLANSLDEYQEKFILPLFQEVLFTEAKRYNYVGSSEKLLLEPPADLTEIIEKIDFWLWARRSGFLPKPIGEVTVTYVVDDLGCLWIADRHSEHVACARGKQVLAAGELSLEWVEDIPVVTRATNQSTGYCPEPSCWDVLEKVFGWLEIVHPDRFSAEFVFRRCNSCGAINIVKDGVFECAECESQLDLEWNF